MFLTYLDFIQKTVLRIFPNKLLLQNVTIFISTCKKKKLIFTASARLT